MLISKFRFPTVVRLKSVCAHRAEATFVKDVMRTTAYPQTNGTRYARISRYREDGDSRQQIVRWYTRYVVIWSARAREFRRKQVWQIRCQILLRDKRAELIVSKLSAATFARTAHFVPDSIRCRLDLNACIMRGGVAVQTIFFIVERNSIFFKKSAKICNI